VRATGEEGKIGNRTLPMFIWRLFWLREPKMILQVALVMVTVYLKGRELWG